MSNIYMFIYMDYELDLMELRLNELKDIVHKFIIVEYPVGFNFLPRRMYFDENKERFKDFNDQIIHVIDKTKYQTNSSLGMLWFRRFSPVLMEVLKNCNDDDFIISCDSDVLLKKEAFDNIDLSRQTSFRMPWYLWKFNVTSPQGCFAWTVSTPYWIMKCAGSPGKMVGYHHEGQEIQYIDNSGFHFSKSGTSEQISEHIKGYPHQEFNRPQYTNTNRIQERMDNLWGWSDCSNGTSGKDWDWYVEPIDLSLYPEYLRNHPEIYRKYFDYRKGIINNMGIEGWK